jgi:hypothetical protein
MGLVFYLFTGGTSWTGKILENSEARMISSMAIAVSNSETRN